MTSIVSVTSLKTVQQKHIMEETRTMEELSTRLNELEKTLLWQSEKLNTLERTLEKLANPSLMYKRPTGEDYETVAQTLDFLHNNVEGLKEDLAKLSQAV